MKRLVTLSLAALFVACGETPTEQAVDPSFGIADAPAVSGIVMRGETPVGLTWADPDKGTRIVTGADIYEFCTGPTDFRLVAFQDVAVSDDQTVRLFQGEDLWTGVFPFTAFDCGLFLSTDPVGIGLADLIGTDNDLGGYSGTNTNTWGWSVTGKLETPSGKSVNVSARIRRLWNADGIQTIHRKIQVSG